MELHKGTIEELRNLETELRLRALSGEIETPPGTRYGETPEERQRAWEEFVLFVFYQRQLGKVKI